MRLLKKRNMPAYFFLVLGFFGTFFPLRRASDSPMAMACLRLVTFLPELPDRNVPFFRLRIAPATFLPAPLL